MELTNTHIKEENVPLFVFETEQKNQREELGEGYIWEEPGQMRSVLGTYEVEGVPRLKPWSTISFSVIGTSGSMMKMGKN
ncbi:hypothetical protein EfmAA290_22320 [Enterococcus faecium]|nr:hypothetical protein EfmAA290_22320 [Enterococcus faecium]